MMARMPEFSSRLTSPTVKPSRLSISSWLRTRSPPLLPPPKSRLPSSTMAAHCSAIDSVSSLAAAASAASAGSSESSEASHWAAMASWSTGSLPAMIVRSVSLLNHDFLEQHGADLDRRHRDIDPPRQFLLQAEQPGRAVEVGRPQFAQVSLEDVGDARHRRLELLDLLLLLQLEHHLHLQILHALAGGTDQVDQHVRHFDKGRRLGRRGFGMVLVAAGVAEEQEIGRGASAEDCERADDDDDEFQLALGSSGRAVIRSCGFRLFILGHGRSIRSHMWRAMPPDRLKDAIRMPPAQTRALLAQTLR